MSWMPVKVPSKRNESLMLKLTGILCLPTLENIIARQIKWMLLQNNAKLKTILLNKLCYYCVTREAFVKI